MNARVGSLLSDRGTWDAARVTAVMSDAVMSDAVMSDAVAAGPLAEVIGALRAVLTQVDAGLQGQVLGEGQGKTQGLGETLGLDEGPMPCELQSPELEPGRVPNGGELMFEVQQLQQIISLATAAQTVRIAQFAARETVQDEQGRWAERDRGLGHVDDYASDALAPVLGMSHGPASTRVRLAAVLVGRLPQTMRALSEGRLDPFRAQLIADELSLSDHDTCTAVEGLIHPGVTDDTPARVKRRVRRALADVAPEMLRALVKRAQADRFVRVRPSDIPGIAEWWAQLNATASAQCWSAIDALAHRRQQDDPQIRIDQARADALVDLILGQAQIQTQVTLAVPAVALASCQGQADDGHGGDRHGTAADGHGSDGPSSDGDESDSSVAGGCPSAADGDTVNVWAGSAAPTGLSTTNVAATDVGLATDSGSATDSDTGGSNSVPDAAAGTDAIDGMSRSDTSAPEPGRCHVGPDLTSALGALIPGVGVIPAADIQGLIASVGATVSRMVLDADTGAVRETSVTGYRPSAAMVRHVRLRDGTCRFPSCGVRAERCDVDHVVPFPHGPTQVSNLMCLCRHHHRLKTHARWRVRLRDDGVVDWADPYGQQWRTAPRDHRALQMA